MKVLTHQVVILSIRIIDGNLMDYKLLQKQIIYKEKKQLNFSFAHISNKYVSLFFIQCFDHLIVKLQYSIQIT